jgi:hypothetical protein
MRAWYNYVVGTDEKTPLDYEPRKPPMRWHDRIWRPWQIAVAILAIAALLIYWAVMSQKYPG